MFRLYWYNKKNSPDKDEYKRVELEIPKEVARAMIAVIQNDIQQTIFESNEIVEINKSHIVKKNLAELF